LREAVLLSEEKASDERRRMQRQTANGAGEIRALERLEAEESIWSGGGGGSKSSMSVPLLAPVSTYIDLKSSSI